jgi:hypothetical protein
MKVPFVFFAIILIFFMSSPGMAFEIREGDNIVISEPVSDDLLISGGTVTINAPVKSLTFAGGTLTVNAPIEQNLIGAGGQILVNAPVGTDIIVAGGQITINGDVGGKILAAGGQVSINGKASNVAISGGSANLGEKSHITGDALIGASDYTATGIVEGKLDAEADRGEKSSFDISALVSALVTAIAVIQILCAVGMLILGIILMYLIPAPITRVVSTLREKTLLALVFGIAELILAGLVGIILLISIVGIPVAMFIGLSTMTGILLATIFTGAALGTFITEKLEKNYSLVISFIIGFVLLQIIFLIPILGFIIEVIAVFIGLGALFMTVWEKIEQQM